MAGTIFIFLWGKFWHLGQKIITNFECYSVINFLFFKEKICQPNHFKGLEVGFPPISKFVLLG
jgi:hypothetical protein